MFLKLSEHAGEAVETIIYNVYVLFGAYAFTYNTEEQQINCLAHLHATFKLVYCPYLVI